jgi:DNA-binding MarR family transcriptional regulator
MLILFSHKKILLNELKDVLQLSSGNLDHHIRKLLNVGYITTRKSLFPARPLTVVEITPKGYDEFKDYLHKMREILNQIPLD